MLKDYLTGVTLGRARRGWSTSGGLRQASIPQHVTSGRDCEIMQRTQIEATRGCHGEGLSPEAVCEQGRQAGKEGPRWASREGVTGLRGQQASLERRQGKIAAQGV
ncbi:hypothetical protein E2C01_012223 [Portunus trituberculatus]|uniref:Uncharacterized protein n=1 Tax=Portunus trituberculatus TaxID=210409 RepID=A0A5B7DD50_PORTR|nr:hypothetical protein [Portunus trituberculatus]